MLDRDKRVSRIYIDESFRGTVRGATGGTLTLEGITRLFGAPGETERLAYTPSTGIYRQEAVELEDKVDPVVAEMELFPLEYRGHRKLYELYGKGMVLKYKYVLDEEGIAFYMDHNGELYRTVIYPPYKRDAVEPAAGAAGAAGRPDEVICLEMVHFDFDKANIKSVYIPVLDKWVAYLRQHPEAYVTIEGHTDSRGSNEYNQRLSERRSRSVFQYFVKKGIDPRRLEMVGCSELEPIAPNRTPQGLDDPEGRAVNRRVQFRVSKPWTSSR